MRAVLLLTAVLFFAGCKSPCGIEYLGGGQATITLSNRVPDGPVGSWTVSGLSQAELDGFVAEQGDSARSPQGLYTFFYDNGLEGFVVTRPRGTMPPIFFAEVHVDEFASDKWFPEPPTRMALQITNDPANVQVDLVFLTDDDAVVPVAQTLDTSEKAVRTDFDEGTLTAAALDLAALSDSATDIQVDVEAVWELDESTRHDLPHECSGLLEGP